MVGLYISIQRRQRRRPPALAFKDKQKRTILAPVPAVAAAATTNTDAAVDALKGPEFMNEHLCIDFGEGDEGVGG